MTKKIVVFYIVSILMLANGTLFTWLFGFVGFRMWRQVIFFIGLIIVIKKSNEFLGFKGFLSSYGNLFCVCIFFSLLTLIIDGFNPIRIAYAIWIYFAGLPFVLCIPYMNRFGWSQDKINYFFILLGVIQTIGLFVDYYLGGAITSFFLGSAKGEERSVEDILISGRYCFLSEAPTTFAIYYCLSLTFCFLQILREKSILRIIIIYLTSMSFIVGAWLTGSRQLVLVILVVIAIDTFVIFVKSRKLRFSAIPIAIAIMLIATPVVSFLYSDDAFADRYTSESIEGDKRYKSWKEGWEDCFFNPTARRATIGDGVGYTTGNYASKSEVVGYHYENTFFARISEIGFIAGLISLLLPVFTIRKRSKYFSPLDWLCASFCLAYIVICYVSPNGAATTTQMSLFILLGMVINWKQISASK